MAFTQKQIAFDFELNQTFDNTARQFVETPRANLQVTGVRTQVTITSGGISLSLAEVAIYGLTMSEMNKLSTVGTRRSVLRPNLVTITAGEAGAGMLTVFKGVITEGWGDFNGSPQVSFRFAAGSGAFAAVQAIPPTSINGVADVATIMADLAQQGGFIFRNGGVTAKESYPYYPGGLKEQMDRCAAHNDFTYAIDNNILTIWPNGSDRGDKILLISPETGMVGYPQFGSNGVQITCAYNPNLSIGLKVRIASSVPAANHDWNIYELVHSLDSVTPGGQWFSRFYASDPGTGTPIPTLGRG